MEIQKQQQEFSGVGAWSVARFNLSQAARPGTRMDCTFNGDFFHVPGVQLLLGRGFTAGDDRIGCGSPGAVISMHSGSGNSAAMGKCCGAVCRWMASPFPPWHYGKRFLRRECRTRLRCSRAAVRRSAGAHSGTPCVGAFGYGAAKAWLDCATGYGATARVLAGHYAGHYESYAAGAISAGCRQTVPEQQTGQFLLAHASVRERATAVQQAIGASRGRLIVQLLAESLLLSLAGTALGVIVAQLLDSGLVVTQVSLSLVLLVGALLFCAACRSCSRPIWASVRKAWFLSISTCANQILKGSETGGLPGSARTTAHTAERAFGG